MSQQEFNEAAKESTLFAVFMAEFNGITPAQITLWLNAMRAPVVVNSQGAIAKHFGA
jgi:hypothetical protein